MRYVLACLTISFSDCVAHVVIHVKVFGKSAGLKV